MEGLIQRVEVVEAADAVPVALLVCTLDVVDDVGAVQLGLHHLVVEVLVVVDRGDLLFLECAHLFEVHLSGLELLLRTIVVVLLSVFHLKLRYILFNNKDII